MATQAAQLQAARTVLNAGSIDVRGLLRAVSGVATELDNRGGTGELAQGKADDSIDGNYSFVDSTPIGDAQPFDYPPDRFSGVIQHDASSFLLSPEDKEACTERWREDQGMCWSIGKAMGAIGTVQACIDRARYNYNICMGFTQVI